MAFRHLGGSPQQALPGEVLLVVRMSPLAPIPLKTGAFQSKRKTFSVFDANTYQCLSDDFEARSIDELSLRKGDRIELIERDDDFGDGWYLGRHTQNGKTGLFPEGLLFA